MNKKFDLKRNKQKLVLIFVIIVFTSELLLNHTNIHYLRYESKIVFVW